MQLFFRSNRTIAKLAAVLCAYGLLGSQLACQNYQFVYEPDAEHQAGHLRFTVAQPSKADLLFVVDNSGSMLSKQAALTNSLTQLLHELSVQDTSYRIGIVSADVYGFLDGCPPANVANPPVLSNSNKKGNQTMGAKGNCSRPEVVLGRPNDGTLGRLMAAFDPHVFDPNSFAGIPETAGSFAPRQALTSLLPTSATTGPVGINGEIGARAVIDHDSVLAEACAACGCGPVCVAGGDCFDQCASPVTNALVQAYFTANINGLGNSGSGWQAGMKAALWAVGVDPDELGGAETALQPQYDLTAPGAPNSYVDALTGGSEAASWVRPDALLGVMFLSDAQDCSMPQTLTQKRQGYENVPDPYGALLDGSICYKKNMQPLFHQPSTIASLLAAKKDNVLARVAVGVIGSLATTGAAPASSNAEGVGADCVLAASAQPPTRCACLTPNPAAANSSDPRWCTLTDNTTGPNLGLATCDGQNSSRYVGLADNFLRRTFESVCRNDGASYGPVLADFARVATRPCFLLQQVRPFTGDPNYLSVERTPQGSTTPEQLTAQPPNATTPGYYYDAQTNQVCLTGLDRLIGDNYDILVFDSSLVNYQR